MKIYTDLIQGTDAWRLARAGLFTASESGPFIINSGKVADGARQKLIDRKLAELNGETEDTFLNDAMKRGTALEAIARKQYQAMIGQPVVEVGFISHDTAPLGLSPDGLVLSRELEDTSNAEEIAHLMIGGCEIKAPQGSTAIRWVREKVLPDEHKFQIHHSMVITGAPWWDFYAFCPRVTRWTKTRESWVCDEWDNGMIPSFYIRTHRNAFTDELECGLHDLCAEFLRQKAWLESL